VTEIFLDSNILLYTLSPGGDKHTKATTAIAMRPTISVQVLNEFVNVTRKKLKLEFAAITELLAPIRVKCEVVSLTEATHDLAVRISHDHKFKIYDANIIAAADLAGCSVLYTEDMSHGQRIGRVLIVNPFMTT
jgi:predicted nucleic acid-binding protein